jgi:hypothetical protein
MKIVGMPTRSLIFLIVLFSKVAGAPSVTGHRYNIPMARGTTSVSQGQ